jgi:hypothetical protein
VQRVVAVAAMTMAAAAGAAVASTMRVTTVVTTAPACPLSHTHQHQLCARTSRYAPGLGHQNHKQHLGEQVAERGVVLGLAASAAVLCAM